MSPVPCFDPCSLRVDPITGLTVNLHPEGGLDCDDPGGIAIHMPQYKAHKAAAGQVVSSSGQHVIWDAEDYDLGFNIAPAAGLAVPETGLYLVVATIKVNDQLDTDHVAANIVWNGVDSGEVRFRSQTVEEPSIQVSWMGRRVAGDVLNTRISNTTNTTIIPGAGETWVAITKLSR